MDTYVWYYLYSEICSLLHITFDMSFKCIGKIVTTALHFCDCMKNQLTDYDSQVIQLVPQLIHTLDKLKL